MLYMIYRKYCEGDAGFAAGNLIGLLCSEILLLNIPGVIGMGILLWRVWRNVAPHFESWLRVAFVGYAAFALFAVRVSLDLLFVRVVFDYVEGFGDVRAQVSHAVEDAIGDHLHRQIADSSCLGRSRQHGSSGPFCRQSVQIVGIGAAAYDMNSSVPAACLFFQFF